MNSTLPTYESYENRIKELETELEQFKQASITSRKQAEVHLKQKKEELNLIKQASKKNADLLRFLLESSENNITMHESDGTYTYFNCPSIYPIKAEEIVGHTPYDFFEKENAEKLTNLIGEVYRTGKSVCHEAYLNWLGEKKWFLEYIYPIYNEKNELISVAKVCQDISKLKETEKELMIAKEKAEKNMMLKSSFLANISHEIRTPMNAILGFSELLRNTNLDDNKKEKYIDLINSSGTRLLGILSNILDISKIDSKQLPLNYDRCNLNELIRNLSLEFSLSESNESLSFKYQTSLVDEESNIIVDVDRLTQVLSNLLENAQKFTAKGQIVLGYKLVDSNLNFYVSDTGKGIDPADYKIIFERFGQGRTNDESLNMGTGLGLSISAEIVRLLGGEIRFESEVNQGTTFHFTIPYRKAENVKDTKETVSVPIEGKSDVTILIAEDDRFNFMYIEALMKLQNYKVLHAMNGQEAVEIIKKGEPIDLILMDLRMPVMDGYEASKRIKEMKPTLPIIIQSGNTTDNEEMKNLERSCDAYLSKPFTKVELFKVMKEQMEKRKVNNESN